MNPGGAIAEAVSVARDHYGLAVRDARLLPAGASANQLVMLRIAGGRAMVARCHRRDPRPLRVAFLAAFATIARQRGLPTAAARQNRDGALATMQSGRCWTIQDFLVGHPYTGRPAHLRSAAGMLADFHRTSAGLALPDATGYDQPWNAWLTDPDRTLSAVAAVVGGQHGDLLESYRPHIVTLHERSAVIPTVLPQSWTHGDYHGGNLLFRRGRVSAILDLDTLERRPRVYDLAVGVLMLARRGPGDYRLGAHRIGTLLGAYQARATPLSVGELSAIWPCMLASQLPDAGHLASLRCAGAPLTETLARPLAALNALARQHDALQAANLAEASC